MFLTKRLSYRNTLLFHLTVLYAAVFIVSTTATFAIFYYQIYSMTMDSVDEELTEEIAAFREIVSKGGGEAAVGTIEQRMQLEDSQDEFYRLIDVDGKTLVSSDLSLWDGIADPVALDRKDNDAGVGLVTESIDGLDTEARVATATVGRGMILQVGETLEEADEYLSIFRRLFFILLLVLFFVSMLIGLFLASRALLDMEKVTHTARQISKGLFDKRVPLSSRFEEIKRLGATFNTMLDRIQILLQSMKEINDNIAHDLRSPLARIRGVAEMTLMAEPSTPACRDMAVNTMEECDTLIDMINTMLDITETEAGVQQPVKETVDLVPLIADALELFRPLAREKGIALKAQLPARLLFEGDRKKMQRVMTNIIENAIKYTPENGMVTAVGVREEDGIQVTVEDTGIGISGEDLPRIFERFYRCDRSRSNGGVGLGLCLAKAYIESMNGEIAVDSRIDQGSTFRLRFGA